MKIEDNDTLVKIVDTPPSTLRHLQYSVLAGDLTRVLLFIPWSSPNRTKAIYLPNLRHLPTWAASGLRT